MELMNKQINTIDELKNQVKVLDELIVWLDEEVEKNMMWNEKTCYIRVKNQIKQIKEIQNEN